MRFGVAIILSGMLFMIMACQQDVILTLDQKDVIYIRNDGADMPAYIYGNATSKCFTILLHGGPGDNGLSYRLGRWFEIMEDHVAMVYWDQRGQGMSHGHYTENEVTIDQMTEDLYVLVRTLKYRYGNDISIFILGHSWGGALGAAYMIEENYQAEVDGWINSDGSHDIPLLNKELIEMYIETGEAEIAEGNNVSQWQEIVDYAYSLDPDNVSLEESGQLNAYSYEAEELIDDIIYEDFTGAGLFVSPLNQLTSAISGTNLFWLLEPESETVNFTPELYRITKPSMFIWGRYDFNVPPEVGVSGYENVGAEEKELHILEQSGHSPMDNEVDLFCDLVLEFIRQHK